jgi:hypothetical protein
MRLRSYKPGFKRPGGITVWLVLGLTAILGILALGMDGGRMQEERRRAQATADAAALAAAAELFENWSLYKGTDPKGTAADAARKVAAANGYADDGTTSVITVNIPPTKGAFAGKVEFVEVIAEYRLGASFGRIFTQDDLPVRARAVARGRPAKMGVLLLHPTAMNAFRNRATAFAVLNSPIIVNSTHNQAFNHDSLGPITASNYDVTGNYINSGGGLMVGTMSTGVPPTSDPLRKLPPPDLASSPVQSAKPRDIRTAVPTTLSPGVYRGGLRIRNSANVVMLPGVYIMEGGGFRVENSATVAGLGVMIYNTEGAFSDGPISISSTGKVALAAPLSGPYQGISIFQDRALTRSLAVSGTAAMALTGLVYAVGADVTLTGLAAAGVTTLGGGYIVNTLRVEGIGTINLNLVTPPRIPDVTLVE